MMIIPEPYFKDVPGIGNLSMEKILEEYDYPLLSVLKDLSGAHYLCICYDTREAQHWAVVKISVSHLIQLLSNQLELADAFLNCGQKTVFIRMDYKSRKETYRFYDPKDVPLDCIPEKGELLDAEPGDWDEYIELLKCTHSDLNPINDYDAELPSCYTLGQNLFLEQPLTKKKASIIWGSKIGSSSPESGFDFQIDEDMDYLIDDELLLTNNSVPLAA